MQHGHMDVVGYDTYCKLLDEVVKEIKGIEIPEEEPEVVIDIGASSYIPDSYIESKDQKVEVYQNIALCRTDEDIKKVVEDISDRFGKMPKEVENLIGIAKIKELCKVCGVTKVGQRGENIVFNFEPELFTLEIDTLLKKYPSRIKFSSGIKPYMTYKLENSAAVITEIKNVLMP